MRQCPLYPRKRTLIERAGMSAKSKKRTMKSGGSQRISPSCRKILRRRDLAGERWLRRGSLRVLRTLIWPLAFAAINDAGAIRGLVLRNGLARRRGIGRLLCCPRSQWTGALAYVYFEDEPGPRSVRSGPHSRLSPIAFAADECKSLCELPLTREGCRDSRWAMQRLCHRQADTFIKPTRFLAGLITRNAYAPVCA